MDGCQEARYAITIKEIPCPKCSGSMEAFIRDGFLATDAVCDDCGYVIPSGSNFEEISKAECKETGHIDEGKRNAKPSLSTNAKASA